MLHPVGKLPAAVYWRRRALVLLLLLSVFGGGGWLAATGVPQWRTRAATAPASATSPVPTPALEQVVPSPAGARTTAPAGLAGSKSARPCTDDMIGVSVRAPARTTVGAKPTVDLVVTNSSTVPCVRVLGNGLQEIVLLDAHGARVWGSEDCSPQSNSDTRTLAPGEAVSFPLGWDGLTSEPTCAARRVPPPAGRYVLRGRLGTVVSPDAPLTLAQL